MKQREKQFTDVCPGDNRKFEMFKIARWMVKSNQENLVMKIRNCWTKFKEVFEHSLHGIKAD